jgi:hypothetical protein
MNINIQKNQWIKTIVLSCYLFLGISLSAEAIQSLVLTPENLTFSAGEKKIVTLEAIVDVQITETDIKITGDNAADFSFHTDPAGDAEQLTAALINNCGGTLAEGKICEIIITFKPESEVTDEHKATLEVVDANEPDFVHKVNLTGTAGTTATPSEAQNEPAVDLNPNSVDFGNQPVKTTSKEKVVTLTNSGEADLQIKSIKSIGANKGDFTVITDPEKNCGETLKSKAKCKIKITFTPKAAGDRQATLEVTSNADSSPDKVELTGTGTEATPTEEAAVDLEPKNLDFSEQPIKTTSKEQIITLTNSGTTNLTKISIKIAGDNRKDFAFTTDPAKNNCGGTLKSKAKCKIKVTFTPKTVGNKTATLEAKSDKTSLGKMELTGVGIDGEPTITTTDNTELKVTADPTSLEFGNVIVDTSTDPQTVTLTNEGKDEVNNLEITLIDEQGQFTTTSSTCKSTLGAGKDCTVEITFTPKQVGKQAANLDVTSGETSLVAVPLTGIGVEYVSLGETALAFDNEGNPVETPVEITGGVAKDDGSGDFKSEITVNTSEAIIISARISALPPEEIGKELDIFAIGFYVREPFLKIDDPNVENCDSSLVQTVEEGGYYIVKNDNPQDYCDWIVENGATEGWCVDRETRDKEQARKHYVEKWSGKLADLDALYTETPQTDSLLLSEQNHKIIYQGTIDGTGHVCVYLGYRSGDGTLIFNEDTINIRVIDSESDAEG